MPARSHRWLLLASVTLVLGCRGRQGPERFFPAQEKARQALEAALEGWRNGAPHGAVPGTAGPTVQLVDSHHPAGQRLVSFAVLGLAPGDGPRVFTVGLSLENPAQEIKARYVVLGLDPLWVIRHEDFEMLAHWEHPMKKP
jgi:hypothetical protein